MVSKGSHTQATEDGIRTRAPYETGALIQRLRPTRPPLHDLIWVADFQWPIKVWAIKKMEDKMNKHDPVPENGALHLHGAGPGAATNNQDGDGVLRNRRQPAAFTAQCETGLQPGPCSSATVLERERESFAVLPGTQRYFFAAPRYFFACPVFAVARRPRRCQDSPVLFCGLESSFV